MLILNFSHPLTAEQLDQVEAITGQAVERVIALPVKFDPRQPFAAQLEALMQQVTLSAEELQTLPIVVNLPALNVIAGLLLADLHGRMGYFPPALRLRLVEGSLPPRYEVAEVLNLQAVREKARVKR
jgi:hypothetical protein